LIKKPFLSTPSHRASNVQTLCTDFPTHRRSPTRTDIHIFWEQACGETLGKPDKPLIPKRFCPAAQAVAKNEQLPVGRLPGAWDAAVHIFWWQACGEGLDKPFKRLIPNNFSLMQHSTAKA
jgi:hypothetical protein